MNQRPINSPLILAVVLSFAAAGATAQESLSLSAPRVSGQVALPERINQEILAVQILLDRSGHSPGVVDGVAGGNTARAIRAFQRQHGMKEDGKPSPALLDALRANHPGELLQRYTITSDDVDGPFVTVPSTMEAQSQLASLGYETPAEALAEKFHMSQSLLEAMNPGIDFGRPGTDVQVIAPGKEGLPMKVARIEVEKATSALRAFADDGTLLGTYPATIGSSAFPSPDGTMEVTTVAADPTYHFDPEGRDWGPDRKLTIAAGPNNPVGGTWIDLSKEGYGIHGTPDPHLIGKTSSHGCVRLTNWDAAELALAVTKGTKVEFV